MHQSGREDVAFIVLLAGTGIRGDRLLMLQNELISRAEGLEEEELESALWCVNLPCRDVFLLEPRFAGRRAGAPLFGSTYPRPTTPVGGLSHPSKVSRGWNRVPRHPGREYAPAEVFSLEKEKR